MNHRNVINEQMNDGWDECYRGTRWTVFWEMSYMYNRRDVEMSFKYNICHDSGSFNLSSIN